MISDGPLRGGARQLFKPYGSCARMGQGVARRSGVGVRRLLMRTDDDLHLQADIAGLIPSSVIEIDAYWKALRGSSPRCSGSLH